ncbi:MAG: hypothetical protein AAGA75_28655, partial [Cyanobacteria bacterium P01_E01_bin.6]
MKESLSGVGLPLLGTISLVGLIAWGILWPVEEISIETSPRQPSTVELDVDFIGMHAGARRWRLIADEMLLQGELQLFEQGARGWLFGDSSPPGRTSEAPLFFDEREDVWWQAESAVYHTNLNRLDLSQNVRVHDSQGTLLKTETLEVHADHRIEALAAFVLESPDVALSGRTGTFDFNLSELSAWQGKVLVSSGSSSPSSNDVQTDVETITIEADRVDYNRDTETARAEGNLVIFQGDTTVRAPRGVYRNQTSASQLVGGVVLEEPSRVLSSERMRGDHQEKVFQFEENVVFTQVEESPPTDEESVIEEVERSHTEVRATSLTYNSRTETANFKDSVELIQDGRQARSTEATVEPSTIVLSGDVQMDQESGDWLARRASNSEVQDALQLPTRIYAERVEIDRQTNDVHFYDRVLVIQAQRSAQGSEGIYRDSSQSLELIGESEPALLCERVSVASSSQAPEDSNLPDIRERDALCRGADRISSHTIVFDLEHNTLSTQGPSQFQFRL